MEDLITLFHVLGVLAYILGGMLFAVVYEYNVAEREYSRLHVLTPLVSVVWPLAIIVIICFLLGKRTRKVWRAYTLPQVY